MRASEAKPILDAFGYLQHGLITSAQASDSGIDSTTMTRLCQRDVIRRIRRGVYILAGVAEDSLTEIRAAWLSTSPRTIAEERLKEDPPIVISHVSAASVLELGDITPATHMFSSPVRKQSSAADIRHRVTPLPAEDITVVEGLPVTTPLRTIADLAKDRLDGDQLHHVIANAIRDHRLKASLVSKKLDPYAEHYGYTTGQDLVAQSLLRFPEDSSATEALGLSVLAQALQGSLNGSVSGFLAEFQKTRGYANILQSLASVNEHLPSPWLEATRFSSGELAQALGSLSVLGQFTPSSALDQARALGLGRPPIPNLDHKINLDEDGSEDTKTRNEEEGESDD